MSEIWDPGHSVLNHIHTPVASFTKKVHPRLAKHPLKTNGRLANLKLTYSVKKAAGYVNMDQWIES